MSKIKHTANREENHFLKSQDPVASDKWHPIWMTSETKKTNASHELSSFQNYDLIYIKTKMHFKTRHITINNTWHEIISLPLLSKWCWVLRLDVSNLITNFLYLILDWRYQMDYFWNISQRVLLLDANLTHFNEGKKDRLWNSVLGEPE